MKTRDYKKNQIMWKLRQKQRDGVKFMVWELAASTKEVIEQKYYVEPYLYSIKTRTFPNIRQINSKLLKELHYMCKRGKQYEVRPLTSNEMELLDARGIKYRIKKYKIYLN